MPPEIEKRLEHHVRKFLWGNKNKINVNKETIYAPIAGGRQNLLDIPVRNEAITVTWIWSYLDLSPNHPLWAYAVDTVIAHHTPTSEENVGLEQRLNIFLQSWKTSTNRLLDDLRTMVKTTHKYNVCLDGLAISPEIQCEMPIWHHIKSRATRCLFNSGKQVKCLKNRHKVKTVGNAEQLTRNLQEEKHSKWGRCGCVKCRHARVELGCLSPHKCFVKAKQLLELLMPKWSPLTDPPTDIPIPPMDEEDVGLNKQAKYFQPHLITKGYLSNAFRIFVDGNECPSAYSPPDLDPTRQDETIIIYTDGSAIKNRSDEATAVQGCAIKRET
ncbi:hypothetical protein IW261DRAFT_1345958 [Armillaria novae-zelandiae]|uniref:RNase H type-1 domain-containing protein n=1 Tax=Armillaria novae-zelandiae TaxID=153914 RepID=A0AA39NN11_9AGAR|nr:hypothetical protein IW261DRAFT_1345958 [Armillaria novae-zelandiae]